MNKIQNNVIGLRLSEICKIQKCTLPELSERIGVPYASVYKWSTGATIPSARLYDGLYKQGVNVNWFISGEGQVMRGTGAGDDTTGDVINEIRIVEWVKDYWEKSEPDERIWLDVEMKRCFKEYKQYKNRT